MLRLVQVPKTMMVEGGLVDDVLDMETVAERGGQDLGATRGEFFEHAPEQAFDQPVALHLGDQVVGHVADGHDIRPDGGGEIGPAVTTTDEDPEYTSTREEPFEQLLHGRVWVLRPVGRRGRGATGVEVGGRGEFGSQADKLLFDLLESSLVCGRHPVDDVPVGRERFCPQGRGDPDGVPIVRDDLVGYLVPVAESPHEKDLEFG